MKKILSFMLALLMLCGTVSLFASCSAEVDGIVTLSNAVVDVDLTGYELVYGDSQRGEAYTATFRDYMSSFASQLTAAVGKKFSPYTMTRAKTGPADKEILVGLTVREESRSALADIEGDGFLIRVTENKIVLVGTSNLFTMMAVRYFAERFLGESANAGVLCVNEEARADEVGTLTLANSEEASYTYVHKDGMGIYPPAFAGTTSASANNTYEEYPQTAIGLITERMKELSGLRDKYFPVKTDKESYDKQVLVGEVSDPASNELLKTVKENEFVIATSGDDVIVNAWNEKVLSVGIARYLDLLTEAQVKHEDGSKSVVFPREFRFTDFADEGWVLDFPRPDTADLSLYNTMDASGGALQFLYMGKGATLAAHKDYCDKLKAEGYTVYMENEIEGSAFTTLVNRETGVMLYVAYNAYSHLDEYDTEYDWTASKVKTKDPNVYEYEPAIRIVSAKLENSYLIPEKLATKQTYEKVTDAAISTMPLYSKAVGLSYVITLEDGSFIVFDGGNINDGGTEFDTLWKILTAMYAKINGGADPTTQKPIRIAAWIMTHAHPDHINAFEKMLSKYGNTGLLKMDYMIASIPGEHSAWPVGVLASYVSPERIAAMQKTIRGGFEYIKVHTGQRLYFANLEIEILATWEDLNPWVINDGNETNTVMRFTLSNQDAPATKVTQLWTGDAQRWLSRYLCAMYGSYLESDMVSVGHHGNVGCEIDLYDTVKPTTIWWPHNASAAANYLNPKNKEKGFQFEVDQYFANSIPSVKYIFTSGEKATGDDYFTTLVFTKNGPDYDNIFDLITGEKLSYTDISKDVFANVSSCMKK